MAQIIAGLGAQLGLDTTEFKKGISEAKEAISNLKENFIHLVEITAFAELTRQALEYSEQIVATAKANDVAIASVLELSRALEENGGAAEDTGRVYSGFTQKLEQAAQGNAKAQTSFERLGVSLNDLRHLSEQELFEKTISGLANMKDAAERNGLAFQTLGKAIRGVDIVGLNHTLEESKGTMDKYAESVAMAHELSLKMGAAAKDFTLNFTNAVIPALAKFYDELKRDGDLMKIFYEGLRITSETVVVLAERVVNTFKAIGMEIQHTWENAKILFTKGIDAAIADNKRYEEEVKAMAKRIADFEESVLTHKEKEPIKQPEIKIQRDVTDALQKQITAADQLSKSYESQAKAHLLALESQLNANEATKHQKQMQDELTKVVIERNKVLDEIDKREASVDKTVAGHQRIIAALEKQKQQVQDTYAAMIQATQKAVEQNQKLQESFEYGWDKAFRQFKENAETQADAGAKAFNSIVGTMETALDQFVKTGKLSFSGLAKSIIQDLIAVQLKMQATSLFSQAGSALGSMLESGGSTGGGLGGIFSAAKSMLGFADGGDPPVGVPSVVGERGPEIFVPKTAGTVIPNNMLGGGQNQQPSVTYNGPYIANMQAIDTQSATQFLAKNKSAVWSANQAAQRSLPQSR
jgi:lambda family phage tail tape measure protein